MAGQFYLTRGTESKKSPAPGGQAGLQGGNEMFPETTDPGQRVAVRGETLSCWRMTIGSRSGVFASAVISKSAERTLLWKRGGWRCLVEW